MSTHVRLETISPPFTVYSAKKFPGMTETTALSRCFAKQGIKIPLRVSVPGEFPNTTPATEPNNNNRVKNMLAIENFLIKEDK